MLKNKVNLKNAAGATKAPTSAIPPTAILALGAAMQNGADKYGAFNFRDSEVTASVFYNAMMRHLLDWWNAEDFAGDSEVHHMGHLMAGAAIVIDAIEQGNFIDDRPAKKGLNSSDSRRVYLASGKRIVAERVVVEQPKVKKSRK